MMVGNANANYHLSIPFPMGKKMAKLRWLVIGYFSFAVLYDFVGFILTLAGWDFL